MMTEAVEPGAVLKWAGGDCIYSHKSVIISHTLPFAFGCLRCAPAVARQLFRLNSTATAPQNSFDVQRWTFNVRRSPI